MTDSGTRGAANSSAARITVPEGVLFRDLGEEAVILELASGRYYTLDDVGFRMWDLLSRHGRLDLVQKALLAEYDVEAEVLEADLHGFVERLAERGLVELSRE